MLNAAAKSVASYYKRINISLSFLVFNNSKKLYFNNQSYIININFLRKKIYQFSNILSYLTFYPKL